MGAWSIAFAAAAALLVAPDAKMSRTGEFKHHEFQCVRDSSGQALTWSDDSAPIGGIVVVQLVRDGGKALDQQVMRLDAPWPRGEHRAVGAMGPADSCIVNGTWAAPLLPRIHKVPGPRPPVPLHINPKIVPKPKSPAS